MWGKFFTKCEFICFLIKIHSISSQVNKLEGARIKVTFTAQIWLQGTPTISSSMPEAHQTSFGNFYILYNRAIPVVKPQSHFF